MRKNLLFSALLNAWEILFVSSGFRLPSEEKNPAVPPFLISLAIPFAGLACGLLALIVFKITGLFLPERGNIILFAPAMTVLLFLLDSGRGFRLLLDFLRLKFGTEKKTGEILPLLQVRNVLEIRDLVSAVGGACISGFLLFTFGFLAYKGVYFWVVPVMIMSATVQGHLLSLPDLNNHGTPFLSLLGGEQNKLWLPALFLMLFPALLQPLAILVAAGLCAGIAAGLRYWAQNDGDGITPEIITLSGFLAELATLAAGLILVS